MSKKKKTLKQKKVSDLKKSAPASENDTQQAPPSLSLTQVTSSHLSSGQVSKQTLKAHTSPFMIQDLRNSMVISLILVAINIAIFLLIRNSIIPLRFLGM